MTNVEIIEFPYLPAPVFFGFVRKGPYYRRRLKRAMNDPDNWTKEQMIMNNDRTRIYCRTEIAQRLRDQINGVKLTGVFD